jgi:hypothetical protein
MYLVDTLIVFRICDVSVQLQPLPQITSPGFLGYAVDLMQLRSSMEHLRPALRVLFKDMSVWTTQSAAIAHEQTEHQAMLQEAIDSNGIVIGYAHLYYASLDAAAPSAWVRPQLSHWRLRNEPAFDTAEKLKAAVKRCRNALEAVQARRHERELMFSYTHDDSSDTWCISHGSISIRGPSKHD